MRVKPALAHSLIIVLVSFWLGWTLLVDFFIVPAVFATVQEFFEAGRLGITLFTKLNVLEVVSGGLLLILAQALREKEARMIVSVFSAVLFLIALGYLTWLSPAIAEAAGVWQETEVRNMGPQAIETAQELHKLYHSVYITLDIGKMLGLIILLSLTIYNREKWS